MTIIIIFCDLLGLSFILEHLLIRPKINFKSRQYFGLIIHSCSMLVIFGILLMVFQRAWFCVLLSLGIQAILLIINQAKYQALQEPMVFSDLVMFAQAFKFPRLYFPFIQKSILIAAPILICGLFYLGISLETPININSWQLILSLIPVLLLLYIISKQQKLTLQPQQDLQAYGLLASLIIGTIQAQQTKHKQNFQQHLDTAPFAISVHKTTDKLSDVIVIQSESFFDVRRLYPDVNSEIFQNYDAITKTSLLTGQLNVPAWGANTMRSEFAFLTAMDEANMGLYRYYPYHYISQKTASIARYYQQLGYKTICIHPHPAGFFERSRVFPLLGFDEFIELKDFDPNDTFGTYISDKAVADKIIQLQNAQAEPLFIFAITMENHGPLHLESISSSEKNLLYQQLPEFNEHDLSVYLRHLKNSDKMLDNLATHLQNQAKDSYLCFYGDHVPSIPAAYKALKFNKSQTDYFIWHNNLPAKTKNSHNLHISQLGLHLKSITTP